MLGVIHMLSCNAHPSEVPEIIGSRSCERSKIAGLYLDRRAAPIFNATRKGFLSAFRHAAAKGNSNDLSFVKKISVPGLKTG